MKGRGARPDVGAVMSGLKDFQRETVERVFVRLYTDARPTRRFLLADEVGLGKTLVCKGLIAKAIDHLWERVPRIDVLYVCSNAEIARQNIRRLGSAAGKEFAHASRITLLPITIGDLARNKVNFISITPGTSLDLKSALGIANERALLHGLLQRTWDFDPKDLAGVLRGYTGRKSFAQRLAWFPDYYEIDAALAARFSEALRAADAEAKGRGEAGFRRRVKALAVPFRQEDRRIDKEPWNQRARLVGELRNLLARSCLDALEPDLVILDEFQRFKHLLDGQDPASELARQIFTFGDVRVLLVSATPYKMFTLDEEAGGDDHYRDFVQTLRFLAPGGEADEVEALLRRYRRELFGLAAGGGQDLRAVKAALEARLREVMVRTERLAASADRNGMLHEVEGRGVALAAEDLLAYLGLTEVSGLVGQGDPLEYWKSAPYLLNFMDGYELKQALARTAAQPARAREVAAVLARTRGLLLPTEEMKRYARVDPGNGRLRHLAGDTIGRGAWRLLWLPPSMPYVQPGAPFDAPDLSGFTKRLVFSAWRVVPKAIACLLSYEAERRAFEGHEPEAENTPEARERRRPLLRIARSRGRLVGMSLMGLLYPSLVLAQEADPLVLLRERGTPPAPDEAVAWVKGRLAARLSQITAGAPTEGPEDESWYWAAPALLDMADPATRRPTWAWLRSPELEEPWEDAEEAPEGAAGEGAPAAKVPAWTAHVRRLRRAARGGLPLGRVPADLPDVLAAMALGGFGVVGLRMLLRQVGGALARRKGAAIGLRHGALDIAWSLRRLFNLPEATAIVRGLDPREPYWLRVVEYAARGNLQAVLDEYGHMLVEMLGIRGRARRVVEDVPRALGDVLGLRTAVVTVEEIHVDPARGFWLEPLRMRARFACRLGVEDAGEGGAEPTRQDQVRAAFNSPFWPFVLATTSIGQEGLDFHPYCHAVVHWNLPSNPVDLEQREGRVHRFKGHAVRKNLVAAHAPGLAGGDGDPWGRLFEAAEAGRDASANDLEPYWLLPGEARIERHVPAFPLSRDRRLLHALRRSLVVYRMAFGQPRQEELIEYLLQQLPREKIEALLATLTIDLSPAAGARAAPHVGAALAEGRAPAAEGAP